MIRRWVSKVSGRITVDWTLAKQDGTDVAFNELRGAISGADGPADLQRIKDENQALWSTLPHAWAQLVQAEYDDRMAELMDLGEATEEGS